MAGSGSGVPQAGGPASGGAPPPAMDTDKYNKLKERYNKLKDIASNEVKTLKDQNEKVEKQLKDKEAVVRQQLEEIDSLKFQNGRLSKQIGTLTAQLEEQQKKSQQTGGFMQGVFSGKQQQEAIQKAEDEKSVLRDELMMKINENEELHMQIFELQKQQDDELVRLREQNAQAGKDLEARDSDLDAARRESGRLTGETQEMRRKIQDLDEQLAASQESAKGLQRTLGEERHESSRRTADLEAKLSRWVPFDESQHDCWNLLNFGHRQGREAHRRAQAMQQLQTCALEAVRHSSSVLLAWPRLFGGAASSDGESAKCLQMRTRMSETAQKLATLLGDTAPELISSLGLARSQARSSSTTAPERGHLRKNLRTLLQVHRRWVTYQSLLLLHDRGSRQQDELQAQGFVDFLWRLHRSLRALFTKLQLLAYGPVLGTRGASAAHFDLVRRALRPRSSGPLASGDSPEGPAAVASAAASPLLERVSGSLQEVTQCWESIGRCLSSWAAGQASGGAGGTTASGGSQAEASSPSSPSGASGTQSSDGGARPAVELLEAVKRFCGCVSGHVIPALHQVQEGGALGLVSLRATGNSISGAGYLTRAAARLAQSPGAIGFDEAQQTRLFARRLSAALSQLRAEMRTQVKHFKAVTDEKVGLTEELRALQDSHALLRSNFQVLQDRSEAEQAAAAAGSALHGVVPIASPDAAGPSLAGGPGAPADLLLSSRQRALLDSASVTAQESASLRQHGFFVDVISLSKGEVDMASGPPEADSFDAWERAVRKLYEQHVRNLQAQVRTADGKAMELHFGVEDKMGLLREQEEVKQRLRDEVNSKHSQLDGVLEDIATTRKNYDAQLAVLTEHICTLSVKLSEKDANLGSLQAQKLLCGRCGMWNTMGKLLSSESGGTCQTCREKVLGG